MARSRKLHGPYELHPDTYIITARDRPDAHCSARAMRPGGDTEWRDLYDLSLRAAVTNRGRCTLGRETAIQKMVWGADGWLRTLNGKNAPTVTTLVPGLPECKWPAGKVREDFDSPELPIDFQWLRTPYPDDVFSLKARLGLAGAWAGVAGEPV